MLFMSPKFFSLFCATVFIAGSFSVNAQNGSAVARSAQDLFNQERYKEAVTAYAALYKRYPKEPAYNYYYGLSLLKSNTDLNRAAECLQYATLQGGFPDAGLYYAQALFYSYQFDRALDAFKSYQNKRDKITTREQDVPLWIEYTTYAQRQTHDASVPSCLSVDSFAGPEGFHIADGIFEKRPETLYTPNDLKYESKTYYFKPDRLIQGTPIFFSGYGSLKLKGLEIFRAYAKGDGTFESSENLGDMINSIQNEEYPFYDASTHTLYYASKGRNSIGGYDIFKTTYDETSKVWSTPQNLGFPVNSPFDDILFIPFDEDKKALLVSNRDCYPGQWKSYTLDLTQKFESQYVFRPSELYTLSLLKPIENQNITKVIPVVKTETAIVEQKQTEIALTPAPLVQKSVSVTTDSTAIVNETAYHQYLDAALSDQVKADSLRREAVALKEQMTPALTVTQKAALQKNISAFESEAAETQRKADVNYNKVRQLEASMQIKHADEKVTPPAEEEKTETSVINNKPTEIIQETTASVTPANTSFVILKTSPYSATAPFSVNPQMPAGALFRIQLGVFEKMVEFNRFGGLTPISVETSESNNIYKYFVGWFTDYSEAAKALAKVRSNGISDAFIVSYFDGKKLPVDRVKDLQKCH
jgi:hypothetical protein